jgi:hypothetical protein
MVNERLAEGTFSRLIQIAGTRENGDTATVSVEVSTNEGFGFEDTRDLTFHLKKIDGVWKIDSSPFIYEMA